MKENYQTFSIGELCLSLNGLWKGKKEPFVNVGVIRNANFTKDFKLNYSNIEFIDVEQRLFEKRNLQNGDLIIEKSGGSEKNPVGRAVLYEGESGKYSYSNFTSILRIKDKKQLLSKYLYNFILYRYKEGDMAGMQSHSTGIHNLDYDKYLAIQIPVPSLSEQERIVKQLDEAFAKIDALKENAQKGLQAVKDLWQATLKEELKPKEGWSSKTLQEVCTDYGEYGMSVPSKEFNGIRYLRITDISENGELNNDFVSADIDKIEDRYMLKEGDVVFARTGATVGKTLLYNESYGKCSFAGYLIRYRVNQDILLPKYLFYVTHSNDYYKWVQENQRASAQPNISAKLYNSYVINFPPLKEQQLMINRLDSFNEKYQSIKDNYNHELAEYETLKQSILRKAFSGEL